MSPLFPRPRPEHDAIAAARAVIATKSKSFALASRLLPRAAEARAVVLYAWCRRVDDSVDLAPAAERPAAVARLEAELDAVYRGRARAHDELLVRAFAQLVDRCRIPRRYPAELILGMAMDAGGAVYRELDDLLLYCHRVAGTVGLMMTHVLGVADERALVHAAHLGIAMQLTNICRDVAEDWALGRLYLPDALLAAGGAGGLRSDLGRGPLPATARPALAGAVAELLRVAERYYASGERGLGALAAREALAVRTATAVYRAIGGRIAATGHDVAAGRAVVPGGEKLLLVARSAGAAAREAPRRMARSLLCREIAVPRREIAFEDVGAPA